MRRLKGRLMGTAWIRDNMHEQFPPEEFAQQHVPPDELAADE